MEEPHRRALKRNRVLLIRSIVTDDIIDYLMQENIVTENAAQCLNAIQVPHRRNAYLLDDLPRRGPRSFSVFVESLRLCGQDHLAELLLVAAGDREDRAEGGGCRRGNRGAAGCRGGERGRGCRGDCDENECGGGVQETGVRCRSPLGRRPEVKGQQSPPPSADFPSATAEGHVTSSRGSGTEWLMDDTDGSAGVLVKPCSPEFRRKHEATAYRMESSPRGLALLISNVTFSGSADLDERSGGEVDLLKLRSLLTQLGFHVEVQRDLSAQEMERRLREFSGRGAHASCDACAVALLSHGVDGAVYGSDGGLLPVERVFAMFDNSNAPLLQNKPKIFLVQACRGEDPDPGVDQSDGGNGPQAASSPERGDAPPRSERRLPTSSDMIYGYACLRGTAALRNTRRGAWYVQALVQVLSERARDTHLADMLVKINSLIKEREAYAPGSEFHRCKEMSEYSSTLCQNLFLFPGLPSNRNHASAPR